ncbi:MAG: AGE family epimerase/isomerase [Alphaproteobacteria bacterium]|nr:AGE family epimerase/isomerase [Alphaproteobacteria bacterium]
MHKEGCARTGDEPDPLELAALLGAFGDALFGRLLPIWRERGWDAAHGGFFDRLDAALKPVPLPGKRLLVQCRQLFVFSTAVALAPDPAFGELAHRCFEFLVERYWDGRHGGWFFSIAADGTPHDARKDTYGQAFALFALAHYHRVFGDAAALQRAALTLDLLERHCAAANGGFHDVAAPDWLVAPGRRRQNPHMHLLEAFLALLETSGEGRYRRAAQEMIRLFETVFVDRGTGTLGEYFDCAWRPDAEGGELVEPGHHFEWFWLLDRAEKLMQTPRHPLAEPLFDWAVRHGIDPVHGGVFDSVGRDGGLHAGTKRIWPLAEALRAHAVRCRDGHYRDAAVRLRRLLAHLLRHHLDPERGFIEHLDRVGEPIVTESFGSTPYHLIGAYQELAALAGAGPRRRTPREAE